MDIRRATDEGDANTSKMSTEPVQRNSCPNCGFQMAHGATRCESCGYAFPKAAARTGEKIAAVLLLVLFGVPAALCGGCGLIIDSTSAGGWLMGLGGLAVIVILIWLTATVFKES